MPVIIIILLRIKKGIKAERTLKTFELTYA